MYSRIKAIDVSGKDSLCIRINSGGIIEVLSDVYSAAGLGLGRALNIASCCVPFDAKSRSNGSMSVDGGRQSKEKYRSNE